MYNSVKIVVAGNKAVGITNLVRRISRQDFVDAPPESTFTGNGKTIIWDLSGLIGSNVQLSYTYMSEVGIFLLCCDLSQDDPFSNLKEKIDEMKRQSPQAKIYLVGTKADLWPEKEKEQRKEMLKNFSEEHSLEGFEITSAKKDDGFEPLIKIINDENIQHKSNYQPQIKIEIEDNGPGFFAAVPNQLSRFVNMFLGYDADTQERKEFDLPRLLNPFSGLIESTHYPLSKIRRSTWYDRLVDTYYVIGGKRSTQTFYYPASNDSVPSYGKQTYQKKLGLLDYLTLGIFPLASMIKRGLWAGYKHTDGPLKKLGWGILSIVVGLPSWLIASTGNLLIKPIIGGIATAIIAPIPIFVSILNTLTYPKIDEIEVTLNDSSTTTTLKALRNNNRGKEFCLEPAAIDNTITIKDKKTSEEMGKIILGDVNDNRSIEALVNSGFCKLAKVLEKEGLEINLDENRIYEPN